MGKNFGSLECRKFQFLKNGGEGGGKEHFHYFSTPNIFTICEYRPLGNIVDIFELLYVLSKKFVFNDIELVDQGQMALPHSSYK